MSRIRLDRLMKKLPDGSYELAGYEKHEGGRIYHKSIKNNEWNDILCISFRGTSYFLKHNRKDQYTGVDVGKDKLFENDEIEIAPESNLKGFIKWKHAQWVVAKDVKNDFLIETLSFYKDWNLKIIGIEGVSSKNINTGGRDGRENS